MTAAISVEGLSKKFRLRHEAGGGAYRTFRDALSDSAKALGQSLIGRSARAANSPAEEDFWALKDIGFTIAQGEKVGIIGRNGAGKSTLLKVIARILEPTSGRIRIRGRVASLLEVGTGFHPELTGRENIFFNGAILGMTRAEIIRRFDEIVAFAEVEKFLDTMVKHYSSGMYVRLGFAIAAHLDPEILIVDEILAVGDARFQKKCLGKLQDIGRGGRTVLFVSHNMSSILQFTDRTIVLQGGQVHLDSDSEAGVREYLSLNENPSQVSEIPSLVPWFRAISLSFVHGLSNPGFNRPLPFEMVIETEQAIRDVRFTIGITNRIGARVVTAKAALPALESGIHQFDVTVAEHRLVPGSYFVYLAIWASGIPLVLAEQVLSFELFLENIEDPLLLEMAAKGQDHLGCYCEMALTFRKA